MVCMSGNKGTFDMLNKEQSSDFVALAMNWEYNFSKFILNEMKGNLKGSKSERFMIYPRIMQMIFDMRFPDADAAEEVNAPNAVVEEEHDAADDDVYFVHFPEYEDVLTREEPDMDFDFEFETQQVEKNHPEQVNLLPTENLEALLDHTTTTEPSEPLPQVKESIDGSSSQSEYLDCDSFLAGEQVIRANKGKTVFPEDEPIDTVKLQSRVFELEQDSLYLTLQIQELKTDNEHKEKMIKDLETNIGHLLAIVLDLKQKLQDKFKGDLKQKQLYWI
ncbi:hypothetical protein R6Q57_014652 [Mikania cordata]